MGEEASGFTFYSHLASADSPEERLARLRRHQAREEEATQERLKQLVGIREDYEALKGRLETLADQTSHEIMVPFTKVAYFPGKLKHTNEITCLLGDNWFVERSAKQATEIINRRLQMCNESIKKIQDGMKLLYNWKEQTEQLQCDLQATQGVNIVEHEDDDSWREVHRQKVREYRQKLAALKQRKAEEPKEEKTIDDIMLMLDQRELEEDLKDELSKLGEEDYEEGETDEEEEPDTTEEMKEKVKEVKEEKEEVKEEIAEKEDDGGKKKTVRWSEELDAVKQFRKDDLIKKPEVQESENDTLKITFSHSKVEEKRKSARFAEEDLDQAPIVSSPADIFSKFSSGGGGCAEFSRSLDSSAEPRSILKVKKSTTPVLTDRLQRFEEEPDTRPDAPGQQQQQQQEPFARPIADQVVEKEPANAPDAPLNTHRPLSRFKAARQHKKL